MVLPWSKVIWGKHVFLHVAIATDNCNITGRHNFLSQNLEAKLQVWYLCIIMRTASSRPTIFLLQICTVWCTKLRNHFNAIMEVFYCFTVAISFPGDASDYNEDIGWQLQRKCKARRLSSEATVREEWDFGYLGHSETAVRK